METLMAEPSNLDDPEYARFAWKRYWMLMRWMTRALYGAWHDLHPFLYRHGWRHWLDAVAHGRAHGPCVHVQWDRP